MIDTVAMDEWRIVVPLKFTRAVTGQARSEAPDVDDRGYKVGTIPSAWGTTTVRGPVFGVTRGDHVRVKVVREDIDATAPLFAVSSATGVLTVDLVDGGPIPDDGDVWVRGVARGSAVLKIHLGSATGPLLAESFVRVHSPLRIPITPHFIRIDTTGGTGTAPVLNLDPLMRLVRAIWKPAGVTFRMNAAVPTENVRLASNRLDQCATANWDDAAQILGLQRTRLGLAAGTRDENLNLYVVPSFHAPWFNGTLLGLGISRRTADAENTSAGTPIGETGIIIAANGAAGAGGNDIMGRLVAHEIGHFFRLEHVQRRNNDTPVTDTFGRRQLMYPFIDLSGGTNGVTLPRFDDVGYGDGSQGCLITMKNHEHHSTDGECPTARNAIQSNNWH